MKKRAAFLMLVAIAVISCISASARASLYLFNYSASVYGGDTGEIIVEFDVTANQISDEIGASEITLYRENGLMDRGITGSVRNGLIATSDAFHNGSYTFKNLTPGEYYYAEVTVFAEDESGSDSRVIETRLIRAPY